MLLKVDIRKLAYPFLLSMVLLMSCSSSKSLTKITLAPDFDRRDYVNPQDFGYPLSIKKIADNEPADSSFTPVSVKGGMQKAFTKVRYPMEAQKKGIRGEVMLELYINSNGRLTNIKVIKSAHELLTDASVEAAQKWRYNAAKLNGTTVNSFIRVPLNFRTETRKIDVTNNEP